MPRDFELMFDLLGNGIDMPSGFVATDVTFQMERHGSSLLEPKPHDLCSTINASAKLLCFRFFQAMMLVLS